MPTPWELGVALVGGVGALSAAIVGVVRSRYHHKNVVVITEAARELGSPFDVAQALEQVRPDDPVIRGWRRLVEKAQAEPGVPPKE